MKYQGMTITEIPSFHGSHGKAWRLRLPSPGERSRRDLDGTVGCFVVYAPNAHPVWDHYGVSVVHLRPIEGVKAAVITEPEATHEFMILSLDPTKPLPPSMDADEHFQLHWLRPIDVVVQFKVVDDVAADAILEAAVVSICNGEISPDQDYRRAWKDIIHDTARKARFKKARSM